MTRGERTDEAPETQRGTDRLRANVRFTAVLERLDEADAPLAWTACETRSPDADGKLRFVDLQMLTRHAYRYRLAWNDRSGAHMSDEVRVEVPRSIGFAQPGVLPNPSHGAAVVTFEPPEPASVRVELFDLVGRRVREVRSVFAAGAQCVSLDGGRALPSGVYRVRVRADGREALGTAVVVP